MSELYANWEYRDFNIDAGRMTENTVVLQGRLTTDHPQASEGTPVLVEEVTGRLYHSDHLPSETTSYLQIAN